MEQNLQKILTLLVLFLSLINYTNAGIVPEACGMTGLTPQKGAKVRFYSYPYGDTVTYKNSTFLAGGYLSGKSVGTVNNVQNLQWDSGLFVTTPPYGYTGVPISNFLMEITGYYYAPQTGIYTITNQVDDIDAVYIGNGGAFKCCGQDQDFTSSNLIISNLYGAGSLSRQVYLEANFYYPFKIVFVNIRGQGLLKLTLDLPDGSKDSTVGNNLYTFPNAAPDACAIITKSYEFSTSTTTTFTTTTTTVANVVGTKTITTTTTTSARNDDTQQVKVIYIVQVPMPTTTISTTTTSTVTTGSIPLFTETSVTTIATGIPYTVETIYVIKTLHQITPLITTVSLTSSVPSLTTTTTTTTIAGADGYSTPKVIIVVVTPSPIPITTTRFTNGAVNAPITVSTISTFAIGADGIPTSSIIIVIETPPPATTTTFSEGSVTGPTAISTYTTVSTGEDGIPTSSIVVVIETPPPATTTTFSEGSVTGPTAISTYTTVSVSSIVLSIPSSTLSTNSNANSVLSSTSVNDTSTLDLSSGILSFTSSITIPTTDVTSRNTRGSQSSTSNTSIDSTAGNVPLTSSDNGDTSSTLNSVSTKSSVVHYWNSTKPWFSSSNYMSVSSSEQIRKPSSLVASSPSVIKSETNTNFHTMIETSYKTRVIKTSIDILSENMITTTFSISAGYIYTSGPTAVNTDAGANKGVHSGVDAGVDTIKSENSNNIEGTTEIISTSTTSADTVTSTQGTTGLLHPVSVISTSNNGRTTTVTLSQYMGSASPILSSFSRFTLGILVILPLIF